MKAKHRARAWDGKSLFFAEVSFDLVEDMVSEGSGCTSFEIVSIDGSS
jgi:hypothetical protein